MKEKHQKKADCVAQEDYISDVFVFAFSYIKYDYIASDEFKFVLQSSPYVPLNIENIQILRGRFFAWSFVWCRFDDFVDVAVVGVGVLYCS